jgi:hypothetical protein
MRTRALILTALTVLWLVPSGAGACSPHAPGSDLHAQADHHGGQEHPDGTSDQGEATHAHVLVPASQDSETDAPQGVPTCCDDEGRAPAVVASVRHTDPRPAPLPLALPNPLLAAPELVVLLNGARLRMRQPPPLPYARTRRPLLI